MTFELDKKNNLFKIEHCDKSKKGSIDEGIRSLLNAINALPDFYTTSSCAGRVIVLTHSAMKKRHLTEWIYVSHTPITTKTLYSLYSLNLPQETVWLVMESFIIHVCARTLEDANKLLNIAKECGLKRAGVIALNRRFILEIIGNERIEMPIAVKGKWIADKNGLLFIIREANKKLRINYSKIKLLEEKIKNKKIKRT